MNRKEFFKKIGLGVVAATIAPKILIPKPKGNYLDNFTETIKTSAGNDLNSPSVFVEDNYSWLQKWFDNPLDYFDIYPIKNIPLEEQVQGFQKFFRKRLQPYFKEKLIEEHKKEILVNAIFGKLWAYESQGDIYSERLWSMKGFVEEMGRVPNKNDKVQFIYFGDSQEGKRFFKISENKEIISILNDCKIYITERDDNA